MKLIYFCKKLFKFFELDYDPQASYGTVQYAAYNDVLKYIIITIEPGTWAPGIWAGTEGMSIKINNAKLKVAHPLIVAHVDLNNRTLYCLSKRHPATFLNELEGQEIYYGN